MMIYFVKSLLSKSKNSFGHLIEIHLFNEPIVTEQQPWW